MPETTAETNHVAPQEALRGLAPAMSPPVVGVPVAPRDLDFGRVGSAIYLITPEVAKHWRTRNTHNRHFRSEHAESLARDIREGKFLFNGAAISWDTNGVLVDGQHRLAAIEISGAAVQSVVVTGLAPVAQETIDTNIKRTFGDSLALRGIPNASATAAIVMKIWEWRTGSIQWSKEKPTHQQLLAVFMSIPDIEIDVRRSNAARKSIRASGAVYGLASYLFRSINEPDAAAFFERLTSGSGLSEFDPIHLLRKVLIDNAGAKYKRRNPELLALIIKAWNHYRDGNTIKQLKWTAGGATPESFPEPR